MADKHAANEPRRAAQESAGGSATTVVAVVVVVVTEAWAAAVAHSDRRCDWHGRIHHLGGLRVASRLTATHAFEAAETRANSADDREHHQERRGRRRAGVCAVGLAVLDTRSSRFAAFARIVGDVALGCERTATALSLGPRVIPIAAKLAWAVQVSVRAVSGRSADLAARQSRCRRRHWGHSCCGGLCCWSWRCGRRRGQRIASAVGLIRFCCSVESRQEKQKMHG